MMDLRGSFLRTRVARRILAIFVLSAILPAMLLAGLGYQYMARNLGEAAQRALREQSKLVTSTLLERLATLSTTLELLALQARGPGSDVRLAPAEPDGRVGPRFSELLIERADQAPPVLAGGASLPPLDHRQLAHLRLGYPALVMGPGNAGPHVYLVTMLDSLPVRRLWGRIDGASAWGADPSKSLAPPGTTLCLVTAGGKTLECPTAALAAVPRTSAATAVTWTDGSDRHLAETGVVFLGREYAAPSWTLLLSVPEARVLSPLVLLRRTFLLILALALVLVFVLSHVQLRRTMEPLAALETATGRLSRGEFDTPLVIRSGDEFEALAGSFNRMARQLGALFRRQRARQAIDRAAIQGRNRNEVLSVLFEHGEALMPGRTHTVALTDPDDPGVWLVAGARDPAFRTTTLQPAELNELQSHPDGFVVPAGEAARSYFESPRTTLPGDLLVLPLQRNEVLTGALVLEPAQPGAGPSTALITAARQDVDEVAVALAHTQLVEQLDAMSWGALLALARTIDAVSPWTAGHSERVTLGALEIGKRLGLSEYDLSLLHQGGLLHDIGKVGVPVALLDKPGALTAEEYEVVKRHPAIGAGILTPVAAFRSVIPLVLHHHETLDGLGYPDGLSGEAIPLLVRIMTVADVFDALVSERPYRSSWSWEYAIAHLREASGVKFDERAVEALTAAIAEGWRPEVAGAGASLRSRLPASPRHVPS